MIDKNERLGQNQGEIPIGLSLPFLLPEDFAELFLRQRFVQKFNREKGAFQMGIQGAIVIPRHKVRHDQELKNMIAAVEGSGQMSVREQTPKRCWDPADAGNIVLQPASNRLSQQVKDIDTQVLKALISFYEEHYDVISSVSLLPNGSSSKKLNGVVVNFLDNKRPWWRSIGGLNWSIGRGIAIIKLPIGVEEFIDHSAHLLEQTLGICKQVAAELGLKYVHFLDGEDGRMFVSLAAGPSRGESKIITEQLIGLNKSTEAKGLLERVNQQMIDRRIELAEILYKVLGLNPPGEVVVNEPYIDMRIKDGLAFSGATTGSGNGLTPFMRGLQGVKLYQLASSNQVVPLGTRFGASASDYIPELPKGIDINNIGLEQNTGDLDVLNLPEDPTLQLGILALGFHERWQ